MSLIDREKLVRTVEQSQADNPHKDGQIAANHVLEHRHFLTLIADAPIETVRINLNSIVKFKLTDYGKDIFYHQYDLINEYAQERHWARIEPHMPKVDDDGYTEMKLWAFMQLFGPFTGMGCKTYIQPLEIIYELEK